MTKNAINSKSLENQKSRKEKSSGEISPLKKFFMNSLKDWCNEPQSRHKRTSRKQEISQVINKDIQTIKNMYLYGQGSMDQWLKVMDYISPVKQEALIKMYITYPYLEDKLEHLSTDEVSLLKNIKKLSPNEIRLITKLIETGIKLNNSMKT